MVALPKTAEDPTLIAMEKVMEAESQHEPPRPYLGMSAIGDPCARKLWYQFRWFAKPSFGAKTLANFADGHYAEDLMAERLRKVPGVELTTHLEDGNQIGFVDIGGHFRGHMDGRIKGIYQAPKTKHVWEHKAVNPDKFKKLNAFKESHDEKAALQQWDPIYYGQGVVYMHYDNTDRHYLTCSTAGSRDWTSVRTEANPEHAQELIRKAEMIISSDDAPQKVRTDPAYFWCRWCTFADICHRGADAEKNCRTCKSSEPVDGGWKCNKYGQNIPLEFQRKGCDEWNSMI